MTSELTRDGVLAFIEESGKKVKAGILQYLDEKLPQELPKYDVAYQGFQSGFDRFQSRELAQQERHSGIKLDCSYYDYTKPRKVVVLLRDGIFEIPTSKEDGNPGLELNHHDMQEVTSAEYITLAPRAIAEIDRWAEATMQSNLFEMNEESH